MTVAFEIHESIGKVIINRPEKLNALDIPTFEKIEALVNELEKTRAARGVIFCAAGERAFSVGADIKELSSFSQAEALEKARYRQMVFSKISDMSIPTLAVIDGLAMGGGLELALACTFRLATQRARFSFPEIKLGLLPGAGGTQRLPRLVGHSKALELLLSAKVIGAEDALNIGLINQMIQDADAGSLAFMSEIAQFSKSAIQGIIRSVRASDLPLEFGLCIENQQLSILNGSADAIEGVAAFLARRPALFNKM